MVRPGDVVMLRPLKRLVRRTPLRTFVLYPLLVLGVETLRRKRCEIADARFLPLLL
jgi:hypothetical protein